MKVIIIEDELLIAEQLEDILSANDCEVIGIAQRKVDAIDLLVHNPDFAFLDIQLKDNDSGIDFGEILKQKEIPFIYITANTEVQTLREALQTNPISYISKPFTSNDVIVALEMIRHKQALKSKITLKLSNKDVDVFFDEILFCEAKGSYTEIVTKDKRYSKRINLKDFFEMLNNDFERVHRSFIVNKNHISYKTSTSIYFDKIEIPISKQYKTNL